MLYFLSRINNYVRYGQQDNLVDPTADQIYVKTKELQVQARAKYQLDTTTIPSSSLCLKGQIFNSLNIVVLYSCFVVRFVRYKAQGDRRVIFR